MNSFYYQYKRLSDPGTENESRQIPSEWMPRFAAGYKMKNNWQVYVNVSKGFSPPTLAEIRPSTNEFNNDLQSEYGWNYEAGTKMSLINNRLYIDYSAFYFRMKNAIVRRLNSGGAEYFVNAGGTKQPGMELFSSWKWSSGENRKLVPSGKIWLSLTSNRFKFSDYVSGTENYNGNALTGVPQHVVTGGADLEIFKQFTAYISHNYTGKLPLNDANDEFAAPYHLLHVKSEYKIIRTRSELLIFAGIDNLLDVKYSLGNDINAFGRRFYNTAAGINFYAGFSISLN